MWSSTVPFAPAFLESLERALEDVGTPVQVVDRGGTHEVVTGPFEGAGLAGTDRPLAFVPAVRVENLGDQGFRNLHGVRLACMSGAMANGISSVEVVEAMGRGGMLGIFGAAGLSVDAVERAIDRIQRGSAATLPYGFNLIHSPHEPAIEAAVVDLYLRRNVRLVEASAFLDLTFPVVRYRVAGIHRDPAGAVVTPNRIIAKVSRVEVASKFLAPPPARMLRELVARGAISRRAGRAGGAAFRWPKT